MSSDASEGSSANALKEVSWSKSNKNAKAFAIFLCKRKKPSKRGRGSNVGDVRVSARAYLFKGANAQNHS